VIIDFDQVLDISIPPGTVSPTPNFERQARRNFLRFVRARVDSEVDIDIKSLTERTKSKLVDIVEDCYVQFDLSYQNNQEAGEGTSSLITAPERPLDNEALQNDTQQESNWDTMEDSGLQPGVESKGKVAQINSPTAPQLSYAVLSPLQIPSAQSNLSNCLCMGQCMCPAPASSASVVPDMDFESSVAYMPQYEALWNGGPTDMNLFDSFVDGHDCSLFGSKH
jgi:hypothetical protein